VRKPPEAGHFRDLVFKMIRQPWVERPEFVTGDVQLLSWMTADQAYVYCPNLEIQTRAETKAEALRLMHEEIRVLLEQGKACPTISDPKLTTYFPPTPTAAAETASPAGSS